MPNNGTYYNLPQNSLAVNANVSFATAAQQTVVTGVATQKIRVHAVVLVAAGATTVQFQSGNNNLSGVMSLITGTPLVLNANENLPWFVTNAGESFNITNGAAIQVSGFILYTIS